jgi:hypothetical protein
MIALAVSACSATPAPGPAASPVAAASRTSSSPAPRAAGSAASRTARAAPPIDAHISVTRVKTADGAVITVAVFHGPVRYVLHDGSWDPYSRYSKVVKAGPKVTAAERPRLEAVFNGGFLMRSLAGGYEQEGHVFRKLQYGLASLVIDRSGKARIAVWGVTAPVAGEDVYSVRQNLFALVMDGQPTAEAGLWWRWGGTNSHVALDPRSALGQDAAGDLMYAESGWATPEDMADALARAGARTAMELDINGNLQLDVSRTAGGRLSSALPHPSRPADQYLWGWTRDFVTVLAAS